MSTPPTPPPDEGELLRHLMHGPVSAPAVCACQQAIVRMPGDHWRLATNDQSRDRIPCEASQEDGHQPAMTTALCLACSQPVFFNEDGRWESADGVECSRRSGGHLVRQVIPDPDGPA